MAKAYDEYGNEIEVVTKEEMEAAVKKTQDELAVKDAALLKATEDLKKATDGGDMSEGQKQRLLKEKQDAEDAKKTTEASLKIELDKLATQVKGILGDTRKEALDRLSKGDPELRKKIELEMENVKAKDDTRESILEQAAKAATIVTGAKPQPNFMDSMANGSDRGDLPAKDAKGDESENGKLMRKQVFNISDADVKKAAEFEEKTYGGKMNVK